jgi:hypothetical protein
MFGVGPIELLILGGICLMFIVGLVAVVVVVTMSGKKSNDE